jgi:hypothetical protein
MRQEPLRRKPLRDMDSFRPLSFCFAAGVEDILRLEQTNLYTNGELRRPFGVCRLAYFKCSARRRRSFN